MLFREDPAPPATQSVLGLPVTFMTVISDLIFGGVLDRFPDLRFSFFEGSCGWVSFLMNRLHNHVPRGQDDKPNPRIALRSGPEELPRSITSYFQQLYVAAASWETYLPHVVQMWPDHNTIIGSDFNHGDALATWPDTVRPVLEMEGLSAEDREKLLGGNAMRLLGFDRHPERIPGGLGRHT